ncbi:MAG: peptidoglycan-binding protein [Alphaproteobacteria bacterium]
MNRALHAASGIVTAIVAVELIPRALQATSGWLVAVAFGAGGLAYLGLQALVERLQKQRSGDDDRTSMWMIYIAVAIDLFSDGLMIGAGSAVATSLALILALGQILVDLPEGFATIANSKEKGVRRGHRLLLGASFAVPVLLAATLAYILLRNQGDALKMAALTFTAGLLMVAAVEDIIIEAHEIAEDSRTSVLCFIGGFVLFTLVSAATTSQ